ncbi:MAG: glycosyl hydrolase family 18 protein, partial [Solirubrobacterales bacterium]
STPPNFTATEVSAQSATLSWSPSTPVSGNIVGYRVFRDEIPVGQTSATAITLANLAPSTTYRITVAAVDSLGAISAPTAPLAIETTDPPPTHGNVQAFLLASTDQSFADLQAHYQQIGVVYPTYFNCGVNGEVTGRDDPLVTGWARARQIAVMPRLNCQNPNDENQILNEPAAGQTMINQLAALCQSNGYQGIQIDFEGAPPAERAPFTAFITALAERLHSQGDKLSTIVTAKTYNIKSGRAAMYDDAALSGPSDYIFVLDWGLHWTTSTPGGMDELPWFAKVAEYVATMPNKSKFVLGMPMYGIDWPGGGGSSNPGTPLEFDNVMALESELGVPSEWEPVAADPHFSYVDASGVGHSVWYTDQQSLGIRAQLAQSLGLGIGLWHLGSEDQSIWELPQLGG